MVAEIMQFVGSLAMSKRVFVKLCSPNCRIDLPNKIWNNSAESGSGWVPWCEFWWDGSVGRVTNGHIFGLPPICSQCERIIINLNILICMQQFYYAVWLHLVLLLFVCVCVKAWKQRWRTCWNPIAKMALGGWYRLWFRYLKQFARMTDLAWPRT